MCGKMTACVCSWSRTRSGSRPACATGLEAEGFAVDVALDGTDGLWLAREEPYDAIVLDIMLPGVNGYEVCAPLREEGIWTPILMLTAQGRRARTRSEALDTGADDYLTKPFSLRRARRPAPGADPPGGAGAARRARGRRSSTSTRLPTGAWRGDADVELTSREMALLEFLLRRAGEVRLEDARSSTTCGTTTSRATRTSSRSTSATCATSSTAPSAAARSRRVRGAGYRLDRRWRLSRMSRWCRLLDARDDRSAAGPPPWR